jgi:hypothetical protein
MIIHKIKEIYTYFAVMYVFYGGLVYFAFFDTPCLLGLHFERGNTLFDVNNN